MLFAGVLSGHLGAVDGYGLFAQEVGAVAEGDETAENALEGLAVAVQDLALVVLFLKWCGSRAPGAL